MDQLLTINQIMETTGQKTEAPIIRDLIDEALAARRRKISATESIDQPKPIQELTDSLHTIQALLLKLIEQGQTHVRVQSLNLELLQETLGEARAGRIAVWETLSVPSLHEKGNQPGDIVSLFEGYTEQAQTFAYELAERVKDELLSTETTSNITPITDDDRQGILKYEEPLVAEDHDERAA
ncbi:MAG TPA: hypothetical protein VE863_01905 [Pyrinomonadaceae bacterium]|jgi:hypothetical protein|nr:hypothetical protein [Pyrinomonadaceae bacterium]